MRLLIVDNKKNHAQKIKKLLETAISDCQTTISFSALDMLIELRNYDFNILIIGSDLPEAQAPDIITLAADTGKKPPVIVIMHDHDEIVVREVDTAGCCIYYVSDKVISEMLPLITIEIHKRYLLFNENNHLRDELKKAQASRKIIEIALNCNHQINNPLMTILGNAQLLIRDNAKGDESLLSRLGKIERAAKRIKEITMNLADDLELPDESKDMAKCIK